MRNIKTIKQFESQEDFEKSLEDSMMKRIDDVEAERHKSTGGENLKEIMDFIDEFDVPNFEEKIEEFVDYHFGDSEDKEFNVDLFIYGLEESKEDIANISDDEIYKKYTSLIDRIIDHFRPESRINTNSIGIPSPVTGPKKVKPIGIPSPVKRGK